jgi:hypothetical protein
MFAKRRRFKSMPRFKLGERVALNGLLGELHGGEAIGTVVLVVPDRHGMDVFDEYGIALEDSRQLRVRRFQLTHVVLTDTETHEKQEASVRKCDRP